MTAVMRRFEYQDDKSSKFWEVTQHGGTVTVRYGKTGTAGQTQEKAFDDAASAAKHVDKLVREKTGKGYVEQGTDSAAPSSATEDPVAKTVPAKSAPRKASIPKSPLQDPEASPEILLALLGKDDVTNRLIARHPNASGELLEQLSHSSDKATRQAVAGNPNTPPEIYVRLGQQFPKEFLANPALDVLLMVNPGLLDQVPEALLVRLLKQPECPASLLTWAAAHEQAKVQLAVAMNASAPEEALRRLRESQHAGVREALKGDSAEQAEVDPEQAFEQAVRQRLSGMSPEELEEAWSSGDIGLAQWNALPLTFRLTKASKWDCFPPFAIARILRDTDRTLESLRNALPRYPAWADFARESCVPIHVLEQLYADSSEEVRVELVWNKNVTDSMLSSLADDPCEKVRAQVAGKLATPARVLKKLAEDVEKEVLENVAENPNTPPETLELLAAHLRSRIAGNPATPEFLRQSILAVMATSSDVYLRIRAAAISFAAVPVLTALARDSSRSVRESLASNPSVPEEALKLLASDSERTIREQVFRNPRVSGELLRILSKDTEGWVRQRVAKSTQSPPSLLVELAGDEDAWVKSNVAGNPNTPLHVLESLSKDSDENVRRGVAANRKTPPEVLQKLAADRVTDVIVEAVGNPETPVLAMIPHCKSKSLGVRRALASQAHRSPEILEALWKDAHAKVRQAVTECEGLSTEMLGELIRSTDLESELTSLLNHPNLSPEDVEFVTNKLFNTPARESGWYRQELSGASAEVRTAVEGGNFFHHHGKDPNKAVLAKRPMAQVMALCAGPFIEPARLAKVAGSTDWLVRAAVARNSATPPNLLKKLAADPHSTVAALAGRTQSRSSEPQPERIAASTRYPDLMRTATEVVMRFRKSAAENPGILISFVTDQVWGERAELQEAMTALRLLNLLDEIIPLALAELEGNHAKALWAVGAASTDADVRRLLAELPSCAVDVVRQLSRDANLDVLLSALFNPVLPDGDRDEVVKKLRKLRGARLEELLRNPRAPSSVLAEYSKTHDIRARQWAAGNPSTPPEALEALGNDTEVWVRKAVANNSAAPAQVLEKLSKDTERAVRVAVADNVATPAQALESLSRNSSGDVRVAVAGNTAAPAQVLDRLSKSLERLSKSLQQDIQWALFRNPSAPADVRVAALQRLAPACKTYWERREIAGSKLVPADLLADFAIDSDSGLRAVAAGNPTITRASLQTLSVDREAGVRSAVAANPATPSSILEVLSRDEDVDVRRATARNSSTPPKVLEKLADDADQKVRGWVALHLSTPVAVLESMARSPDMLIRATAARNASMPVPILAELADDGAWQVQTSAVSNPAIPKDVRDRHYRCWVTRIQEAAKRAVIAREGAAPPQTPVSPADLLRALDWLGIIKPADDNKALTKASRSTDWLVRLGAALHPAVSEGILKVLRQDTDPDVVRGAMSSTRG